jgi:hypothetical protein
LRNTGLEQELWGFITATHASTLDVRCWRYCNRSRHNGTNFISVMLTRRSCPLLTEAVAYETFHSLINYGRNVVGAVTTRHLWIFDNRILNAIFACIAVLQDESLKGGDRVRTPIRHVLPVIKQ